MNFTEMIKGDLKEKYSNMLNGKTARQNNDVVIKDSGDFLSNYKTLADRLKREIKEINDGLARINDDKSSRIKAENDERARQKKAAKDARDRAERARWEAERAARAKRDAVETFFQTIALASPIIMCIVFAIILFSNKEQISIVSNFTGWCTGWVFFTIASLITSIVLLKKRFGDWDVEDGASRAGSTIVAIIMIICSIIVFSNSGKLSSNFDPTTFITFNVTGKTTSTSYSTYYSTISFNLKNNSDVEVTYICGEMKLYNGSTQVGSWNVYFNGEYQGGQSYTTTVEFDESGTASLYNTPYSNLGVTYRITSMKFNGDYKEYEYNGQTMTLKQGSSSYQNNNNSSDDGELQQVRNYKLSTGTELLKWLHHDVNSNVLIPDNGYYYISYTNNCNCYTADYSKSYTGSEVFFQITDSYADTLVSDFKEKLSNNGWTRVYDSGYSFEYKKGITHIKFDSVQESNVWNGYEYNFEYYYWNYSAFNVN